MSAWRSFSTESIKYRISTTYPDYGYAGLHQVKQLSEIALNLDYDQFFHMIYDLKIDDNVLRGLNSDKEFSIYPSKRNSHVWPVGLHFMIFNRDNLKKFICRISKESYLNQTNADAFVWLHSKYDELKYNIEELPVEDEIFFYQNKDFFNYSSVDKIKFFIEKKLIFLLKDY
jgi:hypothetical protein